MTAIVRDMLACPTARVVNWQAALLSHRIINRVTGGLYRVSGVADVDNVRRDWSLVLKILHRPADDQASDFNASDEPAHWNFWRREADVYASGLLARLPAGLAAPRCYAVSAPTATTRYLWLEDIRGEPASAWALERFQLAAYHLGVWQADAMRSRHQPPVDCLSRHWLRAWVPVQSPAQLALLESRAAWQHPLLAGMLPLQLQERVLRLWQNRASLLEALEQQPQTLCHLDVWPPNMFARRDAAGMEQTVLLDWSQAGYGAAGEDIANLVLDSVWMFQLPSAVLDAYEQQIWNGYQSGMRAAGWPGDLTQLRFTYAAVGALRFGLLASRLLEVAHDEHMQTDLAQRYQRPIADVLAPRAHVVRHALQLADQALSLRQRL